MSPFNIEFIFAEGHIQAALASLASIFCRYRLNVKKFCVVACKATLLKSSVPRNLDALDKLPPFNVIEESMRYKIET